jgi:hypothetical protein
LVEGCKAGKGGMAKEERKDKEYFIELKEILRNSEYKNLV